MQKSELDFLQYCNRRGFVLFEEGSHCFIAETHAPLHSIVVDDIRDGLRGVLHRYFQFRGAGDYTSERLADLFSRYVPLIQQKEPDLSWPLEFQGDKPVCM